MKNIVLFKTVNLFFIIINSSDENDEDYDRSVPFNNCYGREDTF